MPSTRFLLFPPFRLDLADERLWWETQEVVLQRKAWALLRYLVEHAGQLGTASK